MSQTAQAVVQNLVDRAVKLGDRQLAADIRAFAAQRQFGLVFEHNRPERLRLYGKPIMKGDVVQVLPERGKKEDSNSQLLWLVNTVRGGVADLKPYQSPSYDENECEPRSVAVNDVVPVAEYDQPIYAGLKETGRVERGGDKPYQVVINGENYHALETLAFTYAGKVDCIYIDPPYNTGARDWKYNNDYVDGSDAYRHSKWLAFMERRLKLAKQLLNPSDSTLIVTIDEKEYLRLGLLLEQIFPEASIQMVSVVINPSGAKRDSLFSRSDEYAFVVLLGSACVKHPEGTGDEEEVRWWYLRRTDLASRRGTKKGGVAQFYPIYVDNSSHKIIHIGTALTPQQPLSDAPVIKGATAVFPIREDGIEMNWGLTATSLQNLINQGVVRVTPCSNPHQPYVFRYLSANYVDKLADGRWKIIGKREDGSKIVVEANGKVTRATTIWRSKAYDAGAYGTTLIGSLIGKDRHFSFPKSLYAVEDTLRFFVSDKPNALIVDFFAGSGTTAHAAMRLNHQDGGKRRTICITNNEIAESEAALLTKQGYRQGDPEWEKLGICSNITKPRISSAITGMTPEGDPVKGIYTLKSDQYVLDEDAQIVSRKTGKSLKGKRYKLVKSEDPSVRDQFPMADGFEENAVFFDLTYEDPDAVELGVAFEEIAPLLWLRAGARGRVIEHEEPGYAISDTYAVLFDFAAVGDFVKALKGSPEVVCAFVITDDTARFAGVRAQLPGLDVVRLYENYLQSFKIAAEDAVR